MSDDESPINSVSDIELLIAEVEIRPALYNKQLKEYSDRNVKEKLWGEVCLIVCRDWMELSGIEKLKKGKEIQKKWKNLKDCFARELSTQRKVESGEPTKKRRKYVYFDSLLFLLPFMKVRSNSGNVAPLETINNNQEDQDPAIPRTTLSQNNNNEVQTNIQNRRPKKATQKITSYESTLLSILQQKQSEEINEDKHFALMLVPMLQKLNDAQKHYAKIEILNVMNYAKNYRPAPVVQYTGAHRSNVVPPTSFTQAATYQIPSQFPTSNFQMQPLQTISQPPLTNNQNSECSARNYYSQLSEDLLSPNSSRDFTIASSPALSENNSDLFDMSNQ